MQMPVTYEKPLGKVKPPPNQRLADPADHEIDLVRLNQATLFELDEASSFRPTLSAGGAYNVYSALPNSTLLFAQRAMTVRNVAVVNETMTSKPALLPPHW